jgi:uncharacterized membrane protein YfcA
VEAWKLVAIGTAAGSLGGFFGVGGGILLVPLLVGMGFERHRAHATSLAAFVLIGTAGAVSFGVSGEVDVAVGVTIGIGGIVGSIVGASIMHRVSAKTLTIIFAIVLLVAGIRMITTADPLPGATGFDLLSQTGVGIAIGLASGMLAGLAGIGGGVIIVPASVLLLGLDQHEAQGTSLVAIVLTALAGSVVNVRNRRVRLVDSFVVGSGGVLGALVGSQLALGVEGRTLSVVFGFLVLFVSVRSLYQAFRPGRVYSSDSSES